MEIVLLVTAEEPCFTAKLFFRKSLQIIKNWLPGNTAASCVNVSILR